MMLRGKQAEHQPNRQPDQQREEGQLFDHEAKGAVLPIAAIHARHHRIDGDQNRRAENIDHAADDHQRGGQVSGIAVASAGPDVSSLSICT